MRSIIVALAVLSQVIFAADRSLFKTCEQSSFCRRCRNVSGPSAYQLLDDNMNIGSLYFGAQIRNNENGQIFEFKIGVKKSNIFEFVIDELTPSKRYRVKSVLDDDPGNNQIRITTGVNDVAIVDAVNSANKAIIKKSPFQIDFYYNDVLSLTVNGKGLMRFEHLRTKPIIADPNEDRDSWEETFMGVVDTKPNGPEAVALDFTFPQSEVLFGIPEHADTFALKPTVGDEPYRLYTLDVTGYELDSRMPIYGAVPVIYGHGNNRTTGVFWHNSADTFVDIHDTKTAHFISEAGVIEVFVLLGPTPNEAFSQYTTLTGVAGLPPIFSLGHHQSRWSYMTQDDVLDVVQNFDDNGIPLSCIWLDIDYTEGKRYFTWNYTAFPQPLEMIRRIEAGGHHLTYIVDPHVKKDLAYDFYRVNRERGYFIKNPNGSDYEGNCWPGMSSYVDYFNPDARRFYSDQYLMQNFPENSINSGIWNDMNEPTVFDVPEKTIPKDSLHFGGWEHRVVHSLYAHMQVMGTFDGSLRRGDGNIRPFILTRAFFSGTQRYAAVWTGDNAAEWGHLQASIKMCLSISVAGISFCGADVGGFFGDPEEELLLRWYQAAAYQPFFRAHAAADTKRREPYLQRVETMGAIKSVIDDRRRLLPFWYTLFYEHERYGKPVMRPMLAEYPLDREAFALDEQYMLSDKLLVRPVLTKGAKTLNVYFPALGADRKEGDAWFGFSGYNKEVRDWMDRTPIGWQSFDALVFGGPLVFQKGGTVIPVGDYGTTSSVSLRVAYRWDKAEGTLFLDDGKSYNYRNGRNEYVYLKYEFGINELTCKKIDAQANFKSETKLWQIYVAGFSFIPKFATLYTNGEERRLEVTSTFDGNDYTIQGVNVRLSDEWTIVLSGAVQNVICTCLLVSVTLVHAAKRLWI